MWYDDVGQTQNNDLHSTTWKKFVTIILLIMPSKLDLQFQSYGQFGAAQNSEIQEEMNTIIGCIS